MIFLLDTHVLIWLVTDQSKISVSVKEKLEDPGNVIFISVVSFLEIALKFSSGKLMLNGFLPEDLPTFFEKIGFKFLPLSTEIASSYNRLPAFHHRDPFDRMLIWQAVKGDFIFVSKDDRVKLYSSIGLNTFW